MDHAACIPSHRKASQVYSGVVRQDPSAIAPAVVSVSSRFAWGDVHASMPESSLVPPLHRCSAVESVCILDRSGNDCSACALGKGGASCDTRVTIVRQDVSTLLTRKSELRHLLDVVHTSAQPGLLNLLGQTAHQAAIADRSLAPFNTDANGRPYRNIHASFWFFRASADIQHALPICTRKAFHIPTSGLHFELPFNSRLADWHRGHLLALEQAARTAGKLPAEWGIPFWNITAPDAADVARRMLHAYAPERQINLSWVRAAPTMHSCLGALDSTSPVTIFLMCTRRCVHGVKVDDGDGVSTTGAVAHLQL